MKTEHVVGPWLVGSYDDGVVFGGDAYAIARLIEPIDRPHAKARADANARLIAAAPDLLSALRGMLALDVEHNQRSGDDDDVCAEVRAARTAIEKATGMTANT